MMMMHNSRNELKEFGDMQAEVRRENGRKERSLRGNDNR